MATMETSLYHKINIKSVQIAVARVISEKREFVATIKGSNSAAAVAVQL